MKSLAYDEMISKQILMDDYKLDEETAMWLLRRKLEKDLNHARQMKSILDCINAVDQPFIPAYQGEKHGHSLE